MLCGAPSAPLSPPRRAVGTVLAGLTSLPALALYAVIAAGGATVALWNYLGPDRAPAVLRPAGPLAGGGLSTGAIIILLAAPMVLAILVLIVLFLLSRRGGRPGRGENLLTGRHEAA